MNLNYRNLYRFEMASPIPARKTRAAMTYGSIALSTLALPMTPSEVVNQINRPSISESAFYEAIDKPAKQKLESLRKRLTQMSRARFVDSDGESWTISRGAIRQCRLVLNRISKEAMIGLTVEANEFGGVMLRFINAFDKVTIRVDFGDESLSYSVKSVRNEPKYCSFLAYSPDTRKQLRAEIQNNV